MIVETESFNYAKDGNEHQNLDVKPAGKDTGYENELKNKIKNDWKYKGSSNYTEKITKPEEYEVN